MPDPEDFAVGDCIKIHKYGTNVYEVTRVGESILWATNMKSGKEHPILKAWAFGAK